MADTAAVRPAFEIRNADTGQLYAIYADGRIDGFGDATVVVNRIPQLLQSAVREGIWLAQNRPELVSHG